MRTESFVLLFLIAVTGAVSGAEGKQFLLPTPPKQNDPWTPPKCNVPAAFIKAVHGLFEQGLPDPRGCDYRALRIEDRSVWVNFTRIENVRGWVLPSRKGVKQRFAILWNGLIYPVTSFDAPADLVADVRAAIKAHKEEDHSGARNVTQNGILARFAVSFLLRLGESELAEKLWQADPAKDANWEEPYRQLAGTLVSTLSMAGEASHRDGEDCLALNRFRLAKGLLDALDADANQHLVPAAMRPNSREGDGTQLIGLLTDQERRAKRKNEPIVCLGPGRVRDLQRRIPALIARLDEIDVKDHGMWLALDESPLLQAIIHEGEDALEPLLNCFEKDDRLTRSYQPPFSFNGPGSGHFVPVREALITAIRAILFLADLDLPPDDGPSNESDPNERKKWAEQVRRNVANAKPLPFVERWYRVLADDKAGGKAWVQAADLLTSDCDSVVLKTPGSMRGFVLRPKITSQMPPSPKGEPLRRKSIPP